MRSRLNSVSRMIRESQEKVLIGKNGDVEEGEKTLKVTNSDLLAEWVLKNPFVDADSFTNNSKADANGQRKEKLVNKPNYLKYEPHHLCNMNQLSLCLNMQSNCTVTSSILHLHCGDLLHWHLCAIVQSISTPEEKETFICWQVFRKNIYNHRKYTLQLSVAKFSATRKKDNVFHWMSFIRCRRRWTANKFNLFKNLLYFPWENCMHIEHIRTRSQSCF